MTRAAAAMGTAFIGVALAGATAVPRTRMGRALAVRAPAVRTRVVREGAVGAGGAYATVVEVAYAPGASSAPHVHDCPVVAYVARGAIRSQRAGEPAALYETGEAFIETPGVAHAVSANASRTAPATLIATFVCIPGTASRPGGPR